jgi:hypothetical protein
VDDALARFLADFGPTPTPGRWERHDRAEVAAPCGVCGRAVFAVSRVIYAAGEDDLGAPRRRAAIEAHCDSCVILSHRNAITNTRIGTYDKRTGRLTIEED